MTNRRITAFDAAWRSSAPGVHKSFTLLYFASNTQA